MTNCQSTSFTRSLGLALLLGLCILVPLSTEAQIQSSTVGQPEGLPPGPGPNNLYDQSNACGGGSPASQEFPDFGDSRLQSADDFTVPAGVTWTLERAYNQGLFFNGTGPFDSVIVEVYDSSGPGGLPGALVCVETGLASAGGTGDANFDVTLAGTCTLGAGTWWISMMADMPFVPGGQYAWAVNASANGSEFAFQDPDGLTGNPCTTWGLGITTCGVGATQPDLCFGMDGTVGVPMPSMPALGFVILLAALLLIGLMMTRRLSAG